MRRLCIALVAAVLVLMLGVAPVMADAPTTKIVPCKATKGAQMANSHTPAQAPELVPAMCPIF